MATTNEQCDAWMRRYGVRLSNVRRGDRMCMYPLLGLRCTSRSSSGRNTCAGCLPRTITDHGRYFHAAGEIRPSLFIGQPYDRLGDDDAALLDAIRGLGLFVHVGGYGDGWYHPRTFPIIIGRGPLPSHLYQVSM